MTLKDLLADPNLTRATLTIAALLWALSLVLVWIVRGRFTRKQIVKQPTAFSEWPNEGDEPFGWGDIPDGSPARPFPPFPPPADETARQIYAINRRKLLRRLARGVGDVAATVAAPLLWLVRLPPRALRGAWKLVPRFRRNASVSVTLDVELMADVAKWTSLGNACKIGEMQLPCGVPPGEFADGYKAALKDAEYVAMGKTPPPVPLEFGRCSCCDGPTVPECPPPAPAQPEPVEGVVYGLPGNQSWPLSPQPAPAAPVLKEGEYEFAGMSDSVLPPKSVRYFVRGERITLRDKYGEGEERGWLADKAAFVQYVARGWVRYVGPLPAPPKVVEGVEYGRRDRWRDGRWRLHLGRGEVRYNGLGSWWGSVWYPTREAFEAAVARGELYRVEPEKQEPSLVLAPGDNFRLATKYEEFAGKWRIDRVALHSRGGLTVTARLADPQVQVSYTV